jgi:hypothetical protein
MIKTILPYILIAAAMAFLSAPATAFVPAGDFRDSIRYDVTKERLFVGSVESRAYVDREFVYFPLEMSDGTVKVQIGPMKFVKRSGFDLDVGEMVTVLGMLVVNWDQEMVLAREIRTATSILVLRDLRGLPVWETDEPIQLDPELSRRPFMVCMAPPVY